MKASNIIIFIILLFSNSVFSQPFNNIDNIVKEYPKSISKPEKLAELINNDFQSKEEKARAIYTWIGLNIKYDLDLFYSRKEKLSYSYKTPEEKLEKEREFENELARTTIKKNKAVCAGYATLFYKLCQLTDIECVIINGSSKTTKTDIGKYPKKVDHAWNAIKISNKWKLVDVTWGAGHVDYNNKKFIPEFDDTYFMTPPELFFLKHYPEDEKWLLVNKTKEDFQNLPLFYPNYIKSKTELITPTSGIITKSHNNEIMFRIKTNEDNLFFSYSINNGKTTTEIEFKNKNGVISFYIPVSKNQSGYLTIFYKNMGLVTYKITL